MLQYLQDHDLTATFFVVGSRAISYPALLQQEYMAQHQIAVHTWSHPPMTTLTNEQVIAELGWSKKIIKDVLGVTPNFWRPPYGDVDNRVRAIAKAMGLQTSIWTRISPTATFDTEGMIISWWCGCVRLITIFRLRYRGRHRELHPGAQQLGEHHRQRHGD